MVYQIESDKIPKIIIKKTINFLLLIVGMLSIILFWTSQNLSPGASIKPILLRAIPGFCMIVLFIVVVSFYNGYNFYKSLAFQVTNDGIMRFVQDEKLNVMNKFAAARVKSRHGSEQYQIIPNALITSINISPNRIKIKSVNYNFFNGNGAITIPSETNRYEELVKHFEKLKKDFEL